MSSETSSFIVEPEIASKPDLRSLLGELELDNLLHSSHRKTGIPLEYLRDQVMEVVAQLLLEEDRFRYRFVNSKALAGYLQKVIAYRAMDVLKESKPPLELSVGQETSPSPETLLLQAVQRRSLRELIEHISSQQQIAEALQRDVLLLLEVVLDEPDRLIRVRQSGDKKGRLFFDATAIAKELGWNRQRVYERAERLRDMLTKAANHGL